MGGRSQKWQRVCKRVRECVHPYGQGCGPEVGGLGSQILGVRPRNHAVDVQNSGAEVMCVILPRARSSDITPGRVGVHRDAKDWMSSSQSGSSLPSL